MDLIEPKELQIGDRTFIISKFPAVAGREIIAKYPTSGLPKLGDYQVNEETMLKLMSYVAVPQDARPPQRLNDKRLVDNHVLDWEALAKIELAMLEYNCSFLQNGRALTFLEDIAQKLPTFVTKIVTDSLRQLSETEKPRSEN